VVRTFSTVTVEATPRIAEQMAVAQTLGTLSLSLRSIADNSGELEEAIASGAVKVPDGDPRMEKAMLVRLASQPQSGAASASTGADVSRYQRRTVPGRGPDTVSSMNSNGTTNSSGTVPAGSIPAPVMAGPLVRIARGNNVTAVAVGGK
jgi:pilus assembly protein CpaB